MKWSLAIVLCFISLSAYAACPAGSTCQIYNGTIPYSVTGGSTSRTPATRAVDAWKSFADVGIDCTGVSDSTTALQNAINAMPNYSSLLAPIGCVVSLTNPGISIPNRTGIQLLSFQDLRAGGTGTLGPAFVWHGTAGIMFDLESTSQMTIDGFMFILSGAGKTINTYVNIDGAGGGTISTANTIRNSFFDAGLQKNASFKAISISATAVTNNENMQVINTGINCSGGQANSRAVDGVINSTSTTLTSATAAFVAGDVGQRLRVSYATGILDTTVSSVTNSTTVVMADAATTSQTGATIHIGQAYGVGVYNGPSSNAKNQYMANVNISTCARGIDIESGSFSVHNIGGGQNDIMVYIQGSTETSVIENDQSEFNVQALYQQNNGGTVVFRDSRLANLSSTAYGYFYFVGGGRFTFLSNNTVDLVRTNSVLFAFGNTPALPVIVSAGNNLQALTLAEVGYASDSPLTVLNDVVGSNSSVNFMLGLPTSSAGLTTGQVWNNGGVLSIK